MKEFLTQVIADFIWLRPGWLIVLPVTLLWLWYLSKRELGAGWQKHIASENIRHLRSSDTQHKYYRYFALPVIVASIALAGPALMSQPTGATNSDRATVLILDLSPSMLARDIKPNRLTQAKYKTIDLLRRHKEGEIGLIVYASDAYRVTPLTDDPATIETLVPTLHQDIMPAPGSNVESAVELALKMLRETGTQSGEIVLITDGIAEAGLTELKRHAPGEFRLSILGIGTTQGDTIPVESGVLTDENQQPVIAKLNGAVLKNLAQHYDGRYAEWTTDSADIDYLSSQKPLKARLIYSPDPQSHGESSPVSSSNVSDLRNNGARANKTNDGGFQKNKTRKDDIEQFDRYQDLGYWLILPLLVFGVYAFRRNAIFAIFPLLLLPPQAKSSELADLWNNLWLNRDQQAQAQLHLQNYDDAYQLFRNKEWKAIAAYHRGQYTEAALLLATPTYAEDLYNRGNAQALSGDLQAAMKSYTQALLLYRTDEKTERADTLHNINVLKTLIDRDDGQNPDEAENNNSESASENSGDGGEHAAVADESNPESESSDSQSRVGGSTGPGQSLDQQSLEQNEGVDSAPMTDPNQDSTLPSDASQRSNRPRPGETTESSNNAGSAAAPQIVEGSNLVLSPYSEQWLRDLPQDPGGYLRRKFLFQYQISQSAAKSALQSNDTTRY